MNLKKSDKIIAIAAVLILIVAAVAIVAYVSTQEKEDETHDEPETMTYDVVWTKYAGQMEITGEAKSAYAEPFTVSVPSGSVLTNVDVKISWEDDYVQTGILGLIFPSFVKGYDTLTANVGISGKEAQTHTSIGSGNETLYFTINSRPVDDFVDAEDETEVEDKIDYEYGNKNSANFDVDVNVEAGKGKLLFGRKIINLLKDKGDDFTLTITYDYYKYEILEPETTEDEDVEETVLESTFIKSSLGRDWI